MNALEILRGDHQRLRAILSNMQGVERPRDCRAELLALDAELTRHDKSWEQFIAPELTRLGANTEVEEDRERHAVLTKRIREASFVSRGEWERFRHLLNEVMEAHMAQEEADLFPSVERLLGGRLEEIGVSMLQARKRDAGRFAR